MAFQGNFIASNTHVVVKPFKVSASEELKVNQVIKPGQFRVFHMRSLFRRGIIGVLDSSWANELISRDKPSKDEPTEKPKAKRGRKPKPVTEEDNDVAATNAETPVDKPVEKVVDKSE